MGARGGGAGEATPDAADVEVRATNLFRKMRPVFLKFASSMSVADWNSSLAAEGESGGRSVHRA